MREILRIIQVSAVELGSRSSPIGPITLEVKCAAARSAGNPPAGFDAAGTGNGFTVRIVRHWSSRQGSKSGKVEVLFPSITCIGRIAYPERAEVTKHDMPGRKSLGCPCGETRSGRSDLGDDANSEA
jgi:hypothetical protein